MAEGSATTELVNAASSALGVPVDPVAVAAAVSARRPVVARLLIWLGVAAGSLIAIAELDRLIAAVLGDNRTSHTLGSVIGPLAFTAGGAWEAWASSDAHGQVAAWVAWAIVLDVPFIVAYVILLRRFLSAWPTAGSAASRKILDVLIGVEVLEALALGWALVCVATGAGGAASVAGGFVMGVALLKWVVVVVLAASLMRTPATRATIGRIIVRGMRALWLHRLSAVVVALLVVLACIPQDGVLDQLPDIQRQWIDQPVSFGQILCAVGSILFAALAAFALGRARTRRSVARESGTQTLPGELGNTLWWALAPAAWLVTATTAVLLNLAPGLDFGEALAATLGAGSYFFWGILILILVISFVLRGRTWPVSPRPFDASRAIYAWLVGDTLAVVVMSVGGLGLVRSLAAPVFLGPASSGPTWAWAFGLFVVGAIATCAAPLVLRGIGTDPWPIFAPLVSRNDPLEPRLPGKPQHGPHVRSLIVICGVAIVVILAVTVFPVYAADLIGPVALTVVLVTAWTALLGAFTVAIQDHRPLAVFRLMRLTGTPVLTLAITLPLVYASIVSAAGWDTEVHAVRETSVASEESDPPPPRDLEDALAQLDCTISVGGNSVQPVVMIAAEGGGIRAAYWTARVMGELRELDPCIAESVLVSSGVSGGSVGLVLTATEAVTGEPAPTTGAPAADEDETWDALASPAVVGSAVASLLSGDVIATGLGVRVPSLVPGDGLAWRDRAGLIEEGWIAAAAALAEPYDSAFNEHTGFMLLNSTDTNSGCRVLVGLDVFGAGSSPPWCGSVRDVPATSWWLGEACQDSLDWASAAMLSARFPVVTPGGQLRAGDCSSADEAQLIDGGYSEGSGLGTIADLTPAISEAIREANADPERTHYLLPITIYLRNSSGIDVATEIGELTAEPLVPLTGLAAASRQVSDVTWLQRIAAGFAEACPDGATDDCDTELDDARDEIGNGVIVVAPGTTPTVVPPLGWALSSYSIDSLDRALAAQVDCANPPKPAVAGAAGLCALSD
ncbi:hypothetical protein [Microbacterium lacus]|uniref:hypothetical protein n=1 Tax=Microbacterium lacus TaxID=415217 RepID=UPI0012FD077B|nr:hypothetical protein [Microbacterium lacus]